MAPKKSGAFDFDDFVRNAQEHDVAWFKLLKQWIRETTTVHTLEEALEPMLVPISKAPEGNKLTVSMLRAVIQDTLNEMKRRLLNRPELSAYSAHKAGGVNIYTQDFPKPRWFKFMSRLLNDKNIRSKDGSVSPELECIRVFLKFLVEALKDFPTEYIEKGACYRGVNWVFPSPLHHVPEDWFYDGRRCYFFTMRSFTVDMDKALEFAGQGARTIFRVPGECHGYKIEVFSDFPAEKEILFPFLTEFVYKGATGNCQIAESDADDPTSANHTGAPDEVILKQVLPDTCYPDKASEVRHLQHKLGKNFETLVYYLEEGSLPPSSEKTVPEQMADLVVETHVAMVSAIQTDVTGKNVMILAGATGAGKSTFANWCVGHTLRVKQQECVTSVGHGQVVGDSDPFAEADDSDPFAEDAFAILPPKKKLEMQPVNDMSSRFYIGHDGTKSVTFLPQAVVITLDDGSEVVIVDFAGFMDTMGAVFKIAIDLAFRDVVNMAKEVRVFAMIEGASLAPARGDPCKDQLIKLMRHLQLNGDDKEQLSFRLGVTKCDKDFAGDSEGDWMDRLRKLSEQVCPALLSVKNGIFNVNRQLYFDSRMTPTKFIKHMLQQPPVQKGLKDDCLSVADVEVFSMPFQQQPFHMSFCRKVEAFGTDMSKSYEDLTGGSAVKKSIPNSAKQIWAEFSGSKIAVWNKIEAELGVLAKSIHEYASSIADASNDLAQHGVLKLQSLFPDNINPLCRTGQLRLVGCFIEAEEKVLTTQQRNLLQIFMALHEVASQLGESGYLRSSDHWSVQAMYKKTFGEFEQLAKSHGYSDLKEFVSGRTTKRIAAEAGALAGSFTFLSCTVASLAAGGAVFGSVGVVGAAAIFSFLNRRQQGDEASESVAKIEMEAVAAIKFASDKTEEHKQALTKLKKIVLDFKKN